MAAATGDSKAYRRRGAGGSRNTETGGNRGNRARRDPPA